MNSLEFLQLVWPPAQPDSYYCLAFPCLPRGFRHKVFQQIEHAANYIEQVKETENVFYATHTLLEPQIWNLKHHRDPKTKEWQPGWSVRLQRNMRECREFFFDLDVGPEPTKYPDQPTALAHIISFVKQFKLPRPMVVNSGGGLHIHWLVNEFLPSNTIWRTHALQLRQLGLKFGLKLDTTRTDDTSSVLRVPGTFNRKKDREPRRVKHMTTALSVPVADWEATVLAALQSLSVVPAAARVEPDELGSNIGPKTYENLVAPSAKSVYAACPQMARLRGLDGCMGHNPWWASLGVLLFTTEGRQACHDFSKGYPGYSFDEVETKIDQWQGRYGPTSCAKMASMVEPEHQHICQSCPHAGKGQGPLSFGSLIERAPSPIIQDVIDDKTVERILPDPPLPYKRSTNGAIEVLVESKDGKTYAVEIHPYDLYPVNRTSNEKAETETQVWRAHLPHGIIRDFAIEATVFVDARGLQARLANVGVYTSKYEELKKYMSAYIQELQRRQKTKEEYNHLGWVRDRTEFVLPTGLITTDGSLVPVSFGGIASSVRSFAGKKGTLKRQVELLKFYSDKRYVGQQFAICCSLGSPFFYATGQAGVIVNMAGITGASKSTALYTAASIWGHPTNYVLSGLNDGATPLVRKNRMHMLSNLPFCLDEITRMLPDVAKDAAFGSTQGQIRKGMTQKGEERKTDDNEKSNIVLSTGNVSMHQLLSTDNNAGSAASVRVFEITLHRLGIHLPTEADDYLRELKENYGHVGEYVMKRVVPHAGTIAGRVIRTMKDLEQVCKMTADERFWFGVSSTGLTSCELGNRMGVLPYDPVYMRDWLITDCLPTLRGVVKDEQVATLPINVLTDYIEEINGNILFNNGIGTNVTRVPNGRLLGHYVIGKPDLVLLKAGFQDYCVKRRQFGNAILRELLASGVVSKFDVKETLGKDTEYAKGRSTCFIINLAHPDVAKGPLGAAFISPNMKPKP